MLIVSTLSALLMLLLPLVCIVSTELVLAGYF